MLITDNDQRVAELFAAAIELEEADHAEFLKQNCDDEELRLQVELLLKSHHQIQSNGFLDRPALDLAASQSTLVEPSRIGQLFGRYRLQALLGEGGMGVVYRAEDTLLHREVAIKIIKHGFETGSFLRRFQSERQILANLTHPNIAQLLDVGTTAEGIPFIVLEYVVGEPITSYARKERLKIAERLKLFRAVCAAVQHAHQNLVIHRDLKPGNILVTSSGQPKLLDFGIAKLLDSTQLEEPATVLGVMTPEYASPEQIKGETLTTTSDVYSLGVLLFELVTDRLPYRVKSRRPDELARAICEGEVEKPSTVTRRARRDRRRTREPAPQSEEVSQPVWNQHKTLRGDIDNIVLKAMHKQPERRYPSASQLSEDLRRHLEGMPVSARRDTLRYRSVKFIKRHKLAAVATCLFALTIAAGIAATMLEARRARRQEARAERRFNDVRRLANSFMFEFHDAIKDVPGTLAARQLLIRNAVEYLDGLAKEAADDPSLQSELAIAYERIGDVTFDVEQALSSHRKAMALNESLTRADPRNLTYRKQLFDNYASVADLLKQKGETAGHVEYSRKALATAESLMADSPNDAGYREAVVSAYSSLGFALVQIGQTDEAVKDMQKAVEIKRAMVQSDPTNQEGRRELALADSYLAYALASKGDFQAALQYVRENLEITDDILAHEPGNARYQRDEWAALLKKGKYLLKVGYATEGLDCSRRALTYIERLSQADPADKGHRHALAITHLTVGDALAALGKKDLALESYERALAVSEALLEADPNKIETRIDLGQIHFSRAKVLAATGQTSRASRDLEAAVKYYEAASNADPTNVILKKELLEMYELRF